MISRAVQTQRAALPQWRAAQDLKQLFLMLCASLLFGFSDRAGVCFAQAAKKRPCFSRRPKQGGCREGGAARPSFSAAGCRTAPCGAGQTHLALHLCLSAGFLNDPEWNAGGICMPPRRGKPAVFPVRSREIHVFRFIPSALYCIVSSEARNFRSLRQKKKKITNTAEDRQQAEKEEAGLFRFLLKRLISGRSLSRSSA